MEFDKPIRFSTWHLYDTIKKKDLVLYEVMIAADRRHLLAVADHDLYYMKGIYRRLFGTNSERERASKRLLVKRIQLDEKTYGMGAGCLDQSLIEKYGLKEQIPQQKD